MPGGGALAFAAALEVVDRGGPPEAGGAVPGALGAGRSLRPSVTDTGTDATPEVLSRVAEPFSTTGPQGKSAGLGLAMVEGYAEPSDGTPHVRSEPGRGCDRLAPAAGRRGAGRAVAREARARARPARAGTGASCW